ncbi:hypothetical protein ACFL6T_07215 [Candidatus Zixiibacteriota bacterium]
MTETTIISLHHPPGLSAVLSEEIRQMFRRHRWDIPLLFMASALASNWVLLVWWNTFEGAHLVTHQSPHWITGYPMSHIPAVMAGFWGYWIWYPGFKESRPWNHSMPVGRQMYQMSRISIGLIVLAVIYILTDYLVFGLSLLAGVEITGLGLGFLPPASWAATNLAFLNVFLLATIITLSTERPGRWIFLYTPMFFLIVVALNYWVDILPLRFLSQIILPPFGVLGGLGVEIGIEVGFAFEPSLLAPVLWLFLFMAGVLYVTSRHQEE